MPKIFNSGCEITLLGKGLGFLGKYRPFDEGAAMQPLRYKTTGTVVEVLKTLDFVNTVQRFHLVTDKGNKSLWAVENGSPVRIGHRVKIEADESHVPRFALATAQYVAQIFPNRARIHPWFKGPSALGFLAAILKDPSDRLPRSVLGDYLVNEPPFDGARALGLAIQRSLEEEGTFFLPLDLRRRLAPFTCACNGILYGRDPLKAEAKAAQMWLGMSQVFGDPVRSKPSKPKGNGTVIRCFADLWHWVKKEVGCLQRTNMLVSPILGAEDRPPFRTDWKEFLDRQNLHDKLVWMDTVLYNPPIGYQTKLEIRSAAAYLNMSVAELRRLNRASVIRGEVSLFRFLHPDLPSSKRTGDDVFEQVDLEDYLEKHWVVTE